MSFNETARFEIFNGKNGQYYFRLRAQNGEIILASEGYTTKSACQNGIRSVRENAPKPERYQKKTASNGQYYFALRAGNNQVIGTSELYKAEESQENGIAAVAANAPNAAIEDLT